MINNLNYILSRAGSCRSIFISGGAAVDFNLAGDVDVWFGNDNTAAAETFLNSYTIKVQNDTTNYAGHEWKVLGSVWDPQVKKVVQVIVTKSKTPTEVMENFDISTHMAAFNRGEFIHHPKWTPPSVPPQIVQFRSKTLERYVKICQRYGHPVDEEVLMVKAQMKPAVSTDEVIVAMNKIFSLDIETSKFLSDDIPF